MLLIPSWLGSLRWDLSTRIEVLAAWEWEHDSRSCSHVPHSRNVDVPETPMFPLG
jgi:hypothetical protein